MTGIIVKGVGGYYYVTSDNETYTCRARGKFRKSKQKPVIGDIVDFNPPTELQEGMLLSIHDRKNLLKRPNVSNLDVLVITLSIEDPKPDLLLCDKLLVAANALDITPILCINKTDLADRESIDSVISQYPHIKYVEVSCLNNAGFDELLKQLGENIVCFAGQSGVGKSSMINMILPQLELEVGEVSRKTSRGKHTTRHVELLPTMNGGYVVDTPGFSLLEFDLMEPNLLKEDYPDYKEYEDYCRFDGCLHHKEPGCAVKAAVNDGHIHKKRYDRYVTMLEELIENWRNRYE